MDTHTHTPSPHSPSLLNGILPLGHGESRSLADVRPVTEMDLPVGCNLISNQNHVLFRGRDRKIVLAETGDLCGHEAQPVWVFQ